MPAMQSPPPKMKPVPPRFECHCLICERIEVTASAELPQHWEKTDRDGEAICGECAAWLDGAAQ